MRLVLIMLSLAGSWGRAEGLTASEFLQPVNTRSAQTVGWPARLTFDAVTLDNVAGFRTLLNQSWIVTYHCEGRPIEAQFLANLEALSDKYFLFIERYDSKTMHVSTRKMNFDSQPEGSAVELGSTSYEVTSLGAGSYQIRYDAIFVPATLQIIRVRETGELGISAGDPRLPLCDAVHPLGVVLLPTANLSS